MRRPGKHGFILAGLFCLILILPIIVYRTLSTQWLELGWRNPVDLSMLEWTGAFLSVFLFLLLLEHFRQTGALSFVFVGCGFLFMGAFSFFYVFQPLGNEFSMWIKATSLMGGALSFCLCAVFRDRTENDFPRALVRCVLPYVVLTPLALWLLWISKPLLPSLLAGEDLAVDTLFARFFFITIAGLFFVSAIYWLRRYFKTWRREALMIVIVTLIFAQMAVVVNYTRVWGVLWWGWHLVVVVNALLASLYLLATCVRRSLIWRLLLSLGLSFGITIIISSAVIQRYTDGIVEKIMQTKVHDRHRQLLLNYSFPIKIASNHVRNLQRVLERRLPLVVDQERERLDLLLGETEIVWPELIMTTGIAGPGFDAFVDESGAEKATRVFRDFRAVWDRHLRRGGENPLKRFRYLSEDNVLNVFVASPLRRHGKVIGCVYDSIDFLDIRKGSVIPHRTDTFGEGRLAFDKTDGSIIFASLPLNFTEELERRNDLERASETIRRLVAKFMDLDASGRVDDVVLLGKQYVIFANPLPNTDLVFLEIVDRDYFPSAEARKFKYVIVGAGMAALLIGFVMLLLLLNYQLAKPLNKLIRAAHGLEERDFNVQVGLKSQNELGVLARTFDEMVVRLRELYEDLDDSLKRKTAALKLAEQVNLTQNSYFEAISHALRTPLHSILSFSTFGADRQKAGTIDKAVEYFNIINNSAKGLLNIIDELLDLIKIGANQLSLEPVPTNLFVVALQAYGELKTRFEEKRIEFKCAKPTFDATIVVDKLKMAKVFHHLLDNAVKFTNPDTVVDVSFREDADDVTVSIKDRGPGVAGKDLDLIFGKFVRFAGNSDESEGAGLGLYVSREIVTLHGGTIHVRNRTGGGAEFVFSLPKIEDERVDLSS